MRAATAIIFFDFQDLRRLQIFRVQATSFRLIVTLDCGGFFAHRSTGFTVTRRRSELHANEVASRGTSGDQRSRGGRKRRHCATDVVTSESFGPGHHSSCAHIYVSTCDRPESCDLAEIFLRAQIPACIVFELAALRETARTGMTLRHQYDLSRVVHLTLIFNTDAGHCRGNVAATCRSVPFLNFKIVA